MNPMNNGLGRRWFIALALVAMLEVLVVSRAAPQIATPVPVETQADIDGGQQIQEPTGEEIEDDGHPAPSAMIEAEPVLVADPQPDPGPIEDGTPGAGAQSQHVHVETTLTAESVVSNSVGVTCVQLSPGDDVVGTGEYVVFQCDNAPTDLIKAGSVPSYYLRINSITTGWRWSYWPSMTPPDGDPASSPSGWTAPSTSTSAPFYGGNNVTRAYLAFGPDPSLATSGPGSFEIEFLQGMGYPKRGAPYPDPRTALLSATYADQVAACFPTVTSTDAGFEPSTRSPDGYSGSSAVVSLTIGVLEDGACAGYPPTWTVQMSATALTGPGGASIPPGSISYGGADQAGSPPSGLVPILESMSLSSNAQTIAVGGADAEAGMWPVVLLLIPPVDAPPGDYSGTLTIDIAVSSG